MRKLKIFMLMSFVFISSCGKVKTSSSNDVYMYGAGVSGSSNFLNARGVLATQCMTCHSQWGNYTEQDFISNFLVIRGSPVGSLLYYRIRGNDVGIAGDMPIGATNMSNEDMKKVKDWITQM